LEDWLRENPENAKLLDQLTNSYNAPLTVSDDDEQTAWTRLKSHLDQKPSAHVYPLQLASFWYRAAAIAAVCSCAALLIVYRSYLPVKNDLAAQIKPGRPVATLITAQGNAIQLGDSTVQLSTHGVPAHATPSSLSYFISAISPVEEEINELHVPRGGEFQLTLSDGTKVWLNAGSVLKYPTVFQGSRRTVRLTGEAYFEVEKDQSKPFFVEALGQSIKVTGTSFNVSAYPLEKNILTTLEEGLVSIHNQKGNSLKLVPGQQAVFNIESQNMLAKIVDPSPFTSWRQGEFMFDDEELGSILQKLGRWYHVEIKYENAALTQTRFSVHIDKYQPIDEILHLIELTRVVEFEIKDKTVTVR